MIVDLSYNFDQLNLFFYYLFLLLNGPLFHQEFLKFKKIFLFKLNIFKFTLITANADRIL